MPTGLMAMACSQEYHFNEPENMVAKYSHRPVSLEINIICGVSHRSEYRDPSQSTCKLVEDLFVHPTHPFPGPSIASPGLSACHQTDQCCQHCLLLS